MARQVRTAAGIHMSTFKDKGETEPAVQDEDAEDDLDASLWTAPPSFLADMRRAEEKAGVTTVVT